MKLLLHSCCAPCSVACLDSLREDHITPALFWYNPNIHPRDEYERRRDTLFAYAETRGLELIKDDHYQQEQCIELLRGEAYSKLAPLVASTPLYPIAASTPPLPFPARCQFCYRARMERTARAAKEQGFDAFTTTLLISPYQNHEQLKEEAEAAAKKYGAAFLYRDFRPGFREGQNKARALGMYMQKYCGCLFSKQERGLP